MFYSNAVWSVPAGSSAGNAITYGPNGLTYSIPFITGGLCSGYYSYNSGSSMDTNGSAFINAANKSFYAPWKNMFYTWQVDLQNTVNTNCTKTDYDYRANWAPGVSN
jgi:hypothetical protein